MRFQPAILEMRARRFIISGTLRVPYQTSFRRSTSEDSRNNGLGHQRVGLPCVRLVVQDELEATDEFDAEQG